MRMCLFSNRELDDTLTLLQGNVVSVQEVTVESSLEAATEDLSEAVLAVDLVSVDPVQDVEESVHAESSHVVRGYVLNNSYLVEHDNLWDEGHGLQPQAEAPLELEPPLVVREGMVFCLVRGVANHRQYDGSWDQCFEMGEVITELVISLYKNGKECYQFKSHQ